MKKQIQLPGKAGKEGDSDPKSKEKINESDWPNEDQPIDLGTEPPESKFEIQKTKGKVNQRDVFDLAVGILIGATIIFVIFGLLRAFSSELFSNDQGIKEVWDTSKTIIQAVLILVLGLYFGRKRNR